MKQFVDTLNVLQPSWQPQTFLPVTTGTELPAYGVRKDGVYGTVCAHVHAQDPTLNPQVDGQVLTFDIVDFDSVGFVSGPVPIDRLVVPVTLAGTYLILAQADTSQSANNQAQGLVITVNGSVGVGKAEDQKQGSNGGSFNVTAIWQLGDGDYVQLRYQDQASNANAYLKVVEPGTPSFALIRLGG